VKVVAFRKRLTPAQTAQVVDEFGRLEAELREMKPKQQRYEQLRIEIASWYERKDALRAFAVEGREYSVEISARSKVRRIISMEALMRQLGRTDFLRLCTFPLKALDEHIPAANQAGLVEETSTGPRRIRAVRKSEALARAG
jgi:hypothetical protein